MSTTEILRNLTDGALSDRAAKILHADRVGSGAYTEDIFSAHIAMVNEKGASYLDFLEKMSSNPASAPMLGFLLASGPAAVYALLEQMSAAGLVDKKLLTKSAGITSTTVAAERPWFRSILDEVAPIGFKAMDDHLRSNLEDYRKKFPSIPSNVSSLKDLLIECKKSTLFSSVDGLDISVKQKDGSNKDVSTALGFRIDAHSAARNGGWDPEENKFIEKVDKKAEPEKTEASAK